MHFWLLAARRSPRGAFGVPGFVASPSEAAPIGCFWAIEAGRAKPHSRLAEPPEGGLTKTYVISKGGLVAPTARNHMEATRPPLEILLVFYIFIIITIFILFPCMYPIIITRAGRSPLVREPSLPHWRSLHTHYS
jgi:hypothetical protein